MYDQLGPFILAAAVVYFVVRDRVETDPDPVDRLREQYAAGEIDTEEFERRLEFHLDDRNAQIQATVEDVNGVGEKTSKAIAEEFASLDELRDADQEALKDIHGVGKNTAEAVFDRIQ